MSRFDAFAKSRASGRSWLAAWLGSRSEPVASTAPDPSRRNLLKRAGLVGGAAVVGSTLIQSVTSPVVAASVPCTGTNATGTCGGTCPPCPITQGCAQDVDCEPGAYCNGTCRAVPVPLQGNTTACVSDRQCVSFYCNSTTHKCEASPTGDGYPGDPCHAANPLTADAQCVGGLGTSRCVNGTCRSGNNGYCGKQDDCAEPLICHTDEHRCLYPP